MTRFLSLNRKHSGFGMLSMNSKNRFYLITDLRYIVDAKASRKTRRIREHEWVNIGNGYKQD